MGQGRDSYQNLYRDFGHADFMSFSSEYEKLMYAVKNPAFLKVASMQCDTFSMGEFRLYDKQGAEVYDHPVLELLKSPNFGQTTDEFTWEWMFWLMLGQSTIRATGADFNSLTPPLLIPLNATALEKPRGQKLLDPRNILSRETFEAQRELKYLYHTGDGQAVEIPGYELIQSRDLGLGTDEATRIGGLLKIIQNNERTIDSQNVNIRYAGKFMVSGQVDPNDVTTLPMAEDERRDIETKSLKSNPVQAVKTIVDIKRYVKDKMFIALGDAYNQTYYQIGSMYSIPADVLEAFASSTFENQKQARGAHVTNTLEPKGRVMCSAILKHFGLDREGFKLDYDFSHLSFMQIFEVERYEAQIRRQAAIKAKIENFQSLREAGLKLEDLDEL